MGEFGLIHRIRAFLPPPAPPVLLGPGDDAALFSPPPGETLAFSIDSLVEGTHFQTAWMHPTHLGSRVIRQGLSDMAAMGARPLGVLVDLSLPKGTPEAFFDDFLKGVLAASAAFSCPLAGGNLTRSPSGIATTAAVAGSVHPARVLRRDQARPGQEVWVTGFPGSASAGLLLLAQEPRSPASGPLVDRFLEPVPRIAEAAFLRDTGGAAAAIDLSDGLRRCAALLAEESGAALEIDADLLLVEPGLRETAERFGRTPSSLALDGGEDFELLVTAPPGALTRIQEAFQKRFGVPLTRIGRVDEGAGLTVLHDPGETEFKHF
ncbi:MAG: thiamine-phosphate kinase [Planctomycetota bacterium]